MYRRKNFLALIILMLAILFPSVGDAWWNQPHQMIGGLTRIISLPEKDRENFRECLYRQMMQDGLVAPDRGRDQAFLFWRLGYAISHQQDSVQRAAQAHHHATQKYADARQQDDLEGCCQAIFQLSEAIHYLQDSLDPTKELNKCRKEITREISKEIVSTMATQTVNWQQLREYREKFKPMIDKINGGAEGIAWVLNNNRSSFAQLIKNLFEEFGEPKKCRLEDLNPTLKRGLVEQLIKVFGIMWAAQDRYLELFANTSSASIDPHTASDNIQVKMKVRPLRSFDSHWEDVTKENATSENNRRNLPYVWLRWPDCPVSTRENRIWFRANISVKGGLPLLENETKDVVVAPNHGFENPDEENKPLNAFIVEIPMKDGHVGKFKIDGILLAYSAKEYHQNQQNAKPFATFPFKTSIQYYPAERSATGTVSGNGSMLSVNISCKNIQPGKRIVRVSVGGKTFYVLGPGVSIHFWNPSGVPESAGLFFVDYGEEITLTAPLENKIRPTTKQLDRNVIDRLNKSIAKEMQDEDAGLFDIAGYYAKMSDFYYDNGVLFDKDRWIECVNKSINYYDRAINAVKNISWKGVRRYGTFLGKRSHIDISNLSEQEKERKRTEWLYYDFAGVAYPMLFSQTSKAIDVGDLQLAQNWLEKLIGYYHIMSNDTIYVKDAYRIADCYRKLAKEVFTQTGDLEAARENWNTAYEWKKISYPDARMETFPFVPDSGFEIASSSHGQ